MKEFLQKIIPQEGGLAGTDSPAYKALIGIFILLTVIGIGFGLDSVWRGHEHTFGNTREIPWGLMLAAYLFYVVLATGLLLVSSLGLVFNIETFKPIARRALFVSFICMNAGFILIGFEMENPWNVPIWTMLSPNPTSNIWWMGTLYNPFLVFMIIQFILLRLGKDKLAGIVGLLAVIFAVAAHGNGGAIFALLHAREFWYGPLMPIYFILADVMAGCASVIFFTWAAYKLNGWKMDAGIKKALEAVGKLGALFYCIMLFLIFFKFLNGFTGQPHGKYEAIMALLTGPYAKNFWIGEIAMGIIIPLTIILAVKAKKITPMAIGSAISIVGILFMRYDLVVVGQIVPAYHAYNIVDLPHLLHYAPTLHEYMITIGGAAFIGAGFMVGELLFRGHMPALDNEQTEKNCCGPKTACCSKQ
ncbi:MAG: polysulfide reductase [Candidatus Electrothrix sp. AR3]|nr:polysulfide reductase [Candidatus Electrothrix sp. AR3]